MFLTFELGSTDYKIFRTGVKDLTDEELVGGAKKAVQEHKGWLYPAHIVDYAKGRNTPLSAAHKLYSALPAPKVDIPKRKAFMKELREQFGFEGPA